ncbi:MAG: hypothetical protein GYB24_08050 [Rhodobacteraceae bacterium]|nr:hypothetical protein [Paracoccaceae bacterium]
MFDDFAKALGQIGDPKFRSVLLRGIGLTVLLLAGVTTGVQFLLPDSVSLPWFGEIGWLSTLLSGFVLVAMIGLSVILMVPVASLFTGFFLDQVVDAVEAKHFPALEPAQSVSFSETLMDALGFFGLLVLVNLLALVIYLLSTLAAPLVFWAVNGVMLGREYFQMVAMRRLGRAGAKQLRARHRGQIWLAGAMMAIPLTVPVLNLVIPVLGVATFTHLFHRVNKTGNPVP